MSGKTSKEQRYKETIIEAYFALAGYRDPSRTKKQQQESLAKCHDLLAPVVYSDPPEEET